MRGGSRPGSGRKPKQKLVTARDFLGASITSNEWMALNHSLYKLAREGNIRAAELLYRYNFGTPDKIDPPSSDYPPIQFIEIPNIPPGGWPEGTELSEVRNVTEKDLERFAKIKEMHRLKEEIEREQWARSPNKDTGKDFD